MRCFLLLALILLTPIATLATTAPITIKDILPSPGTKDYVSPCVQVNSRDIPCSQKFKLAIKPAVKLIPRQNDLGSWWVFPRRQTWQSQTRYTATLTSSQFFIWQHKKVKKISWTFQTAIKKELDEANITGIISDLTPPQDLLPWEGETGDFKIDRPKNGAYPITLIAPFNAGVNGPPIAKQIKYYYKMIDLAKKNALEWFRVHGYDPKKYHIKIRWLYNKY